MLRKMAMLGLALLTHAACAQVGGAVSQPSPLERPHLPDCSRPYSDPRCPPTPSPRHPVWPREPYRRPLIINPQPAAPAPDLDALTDDWDGCRSAKLGALRARDSGDTSRANDLDDWLWKNCRAYSDELRQLEQNAM